MSQKKHLSMAISHYITLFQVAGRDNRFQVENSRDQTQALMMMLF